VEAGRGTCEGELRGKRENGRMVVNTFNIIVNTCKDVVNTSIPILRKE
jgi:hypothetical protein